ncbi:alpha-galactosidase [Paenibacillus solisilvae]|uniref:Alpha-galactosidase n=1 Tax=Paenibacillus solisilvae TaxID=2486751 RepID=A0ABW0VRY7_9BACL
MAITSVEQDHTLTVSNGIMSIQCDLASGTARFLWQDTAAVQNAVSRISLGDRMLTTLEGQNRSYQINEVENSFGKGMELRVLHQMNDQLELVQIFTVYEGLNYCFLQLKAQSQTIISTNYIAPVYCMDEGNAGVLKVKGGDSAQEELLALLVPFDNDKWVRYESVKMPGRLESYEVTAVYHHSSRHGLVFGSVTHDTWKTGIQLESAADQAVQRLEIYGGAAGEYTRDTIAHGSISGTEVVSPAVFIGSFDDYREGLKTFGEANARIEPPLEWEGTIPFGWNSWSAVGGELSFDSYTQASDLIKEMQEKGFHDHGVVYLNFDSFWTNLTKEERRLAVAHVHNNGQKAGTYWTPFAYWGKSEEAAERTVEGTNGLYTYDDLLLRDGEGRVLPDLDGGLAIDPTHPGNLMRTEWMLQQFVEEGFEYVKLDFMAHGTLEGKHHHPEVDTGIQAYNLGMKHICSLLDPARIGRRFFIHLSIAPLFPHPYAHSRRISCDAFGELKDTEYMLNSLTYGWWINNTLYRFNDPDHTVLYKSYNHEPTTEHEGRSRLNASIIAGTLMLMGDDFRMEEARKRARAWLTQPALMDIARKGETFLPLEGNTGQQAADVFYLLDRSPLQEVIYVAIFNYDKEQAADKFVDLTRMGLSAETEWRCEELWSQEVKQVKGDLQAALAPAESVMLKLTRP